MSAAAPISQQEAYIRLPGRARPLFGLFANGRQRLFLGSDHLLAVSTAYHYERYNRFYFADVQSLTIQKTAAGAVLNVVLLSLAGLFGAILAAGYGSGWDPVALVVLGAIAACFAVTALINTAFGPTCQCDVLTAVHEEPLTCLGRLYTAQRVIEHLRTVIEGAQGGAGPIADANATRVERAASARAAATALRKDTGGLHFALFVALLVDALMGTVVIAMGDAFPDGLSLLSSAAVVTLVIAAAIRQRGSDVPSSVRTPLWVALVFNILMLTVSMYVAIMVEVIRDAGEGGAQDAETLRNVFVVAGNTVNLVVNGAVGMFGLYALRVWRTAAVAQAEQQRVAADEGAGT